jgi:hypothetical protein
MLHHMPTMRWKAGSRNSVSFKVPPRGEEKSHKNPWIASWTVGIQAIGRVRIWKSNLHSGGRADSIFFMYLPP